MPAIGDSYTWTSPSTRQSPKGVRRTGEVIAFVPARANPHEFVPADTPLPIRKFSEREAFDRWMVLVPGTHRAYYAIRCEGVEHTADSGWQTLPILPTVLNAIERT